MRPAVFLDRDGVINRQLPGDYVRTWEQFEFLPGVFEALRRLAATDLAIVVVTNQRGIQRGLMTHEDLLRIHQKMVQEIQAHGGRIDRIYYCPHGDENRCNCRKPQPGMLLQAARDLNLSLPHSWMVGDSLRDIQAGYNAGTRTILIRPPENPLPPDTIPQPDATVASLLEAVPIILAAQSS